MIDIDVKIELLSPLHLASGQADVNVDAEIIHNELGVPYFPGRRLKGLLYESALEVVEMMERSGQTGWRGQLEELFHHNGDTVDVQLVVPDFHIAKATEYDRIEAAWRELETSYSDWLTPQDVLEQYTSVRYQTRLENGVAADTSLHNMRVLDEDTAFYGTLELLGSAAGSYVGLVVLALRNLHQAGGKRNRGFGHLACHMEPIAGRTEQEWIDEALEGMVD